MSTIRFIAVTAAAIAIGQVAVWGLGVTMAEWEFWALILPSLVLYRYALDGVKAAR